jgi:protein-disulfide isomerase
VSRTSNKVDPAVIAAVEVSEPSAHVKGNAESGITLVEYSDFQCPACAAAEPQIEALVSEFGDYFQLEYRHFPLRSIHPNAQIAAQAAEAAGMQGKFWEMHDELFTNQSIWSKSYNPKRYFNEYAEKIGINVDRFEFDLESDTVKTVVNAQFDEAMSLELPGTPSFVFNGEQVDVNTFLSEQVLTQVPDEELTALVPDETLE